MIYFNLWLGLFYLHSTLSLHSTLCYSTPVYSTFLCSKHAHIFPLCYALLFATLPYCTLLCSVARWRYVRWYRLRNLRHYFPSTEKWDTFENFDCKVRYHKLNVAPSKWRSIQFKSFSPLVVKARKQRPETCYLLPCYFLVVPGDLSFVYLSNCFMCFDMLSV